MGRARLFGLIAGSLGVLATLVMGVALANGLPPGGTFTDDNGNIHEGFIEAIAADGITSGCNPPSNDLYCPNSVVTRGQMAAFLVRALDLPATETDYFSDDADSIFEGDINRLAESEITKGCNPPINDRFCPDGRVTRGQMAAFLVRAVGYVDDGGGNLFVDDDSSVFESDIDKLGTAGVTKGCNPPVNDRFCPRSYVLRDQMASLLGRARDLDPMTPPPPVSFQVLVFHKTAGFRHDSIPAGIAAITTLGLQNGYSVVATDDASVFTESGLADYDVIVFLSTTRDILDPGQEQAMERFIEAGNGFVGIHSATDTEYDWSWYGGLVGTYFANHPAPQSATIDVVEPTHPTMQGLPSSFMRFDEWYDFKSVPGPGVTILATLDESSYVGGNMGDPHPIVWAHEYDGGRSFYTAFGHTEETFSEPIVLTHLNNAILWAAQSN